MEPLARNDGFREGTLRGIPWLENSSPDRLHNSHGSGGHRRGSGYSSAGRNSSAYRLSYRKGGRYYMEYRDIDARIYSGTRDPGRHFLRFSADPGSLHRLFSSL